MPAPISQLVYLKLVKVNKVLGARSCMGLRQIFEMAAGKNQHRKQAASAA